MKSLIAIAAVTVVSFAAGQVAAQASADKPPTASVSYADLDLSRASGRGALQQRIEIAVQRVCPDRPAVHELRNLTVGAKCREAAWAGAQRQLAAVYDGRSFAQASIEVGSGKR